jgi:ZIP family zinc transporter
MSFPQTAALGALAGFTIFLGLPAGRLRLLDQRMRVVTAMFAVGVLAFIFVDVLSNGLGIVDDAIAAAKAHHGSALYVVWLVALLGLGFVGGSAGLALLERGMRPLGARRPPIAGGSSAAAVHGPRIEALTAEADETRRRALRVGVTIACAIGVHNFAEGLAIGVSARSGAIGLATVLIIGFALHNAT